MEQWIDTLGDIALFVEVARAGSFRHAAARLAMPVSTLSRRIAALERRLGTPLLTRTTRSVRLAPTAALYFERCQQVVETALHAQDALETGRQKSERIRVSMPVDLGVDILGPLVAEYAALHPGLSVDFDLSSVARDLFRDPVALVFRVGRPLDERVVARRVGAIPSGVYAAPAYLRQQGTPGTPQDLARATCLNLQMTHGPMPWTIGSQRWPEAPGAVAMAANNVGLLCTLAERGHGIALLPLHMAEPRVRARRLVRLLADQSSPAWPLVALTATRTLPAQTRGLIQYVRERLVASSHASQVRPTPDHNSPPEPPPKPSRPRAAAR